MGKSPPISENWERHVRHLILRELTLRYWKEIRRPVGVNRQTRVLNELGDQVDVVCRDLTSLRKIYWEKNVKKERGATKRPSKGHSI